MEASAFGHKAGHAKDAGVHVVVSAVVFTNPDSPLGALIEGLWRSAGQRLLRDRYHTTSVGFKVAIVDTIATINTTAQRAIDILSPLNVQQF